MLCLFCLPLFVPQPGDDIVYMAQTLEKFFLQKMSKMPNDEELITTVASVEPGKVKKTNSGAFKKCSLEFDACLKNNPHKQTQVFTTEL